MTFSITTWNINSVRLRMPIVEQFLVRYKPDVLCLQETKCPNGEFPLKPLRALGYEHIIIHGQKGYHGVAIASKLPLTEDHRQDYCKVGTPAIYPLWCRSAAAAFAFITSMFRQVATSRTGRSIRNSATSSISSRR